MKIEWKKVRVFYWFCLCILASAIVALRLPAISNSQGIDADFIIFGAWFLLVSLPLLKSFNLGSWTLSSNIIEDPAALSELKDRIVATGGSGSVAMLEPGSKESFEQYELAKEESVEQRSDGNLPQQFEKYASKVRKELFRIAKSAGIPVGPGASVPSLIVKLVSAGIISQSMETPLTVFYSTALGGANGESLAISQIVFVEDSQRRLLQYLRSLK